jgi:DNA-directed RNA polymerase subunit RPC12/RpoP
MFLPEEVSETVELYPGAFAIISEDELPSSQCSNQECVEKSLTYTSYTECPDCGAKRLDSECPRCGLKVVKCSCGHKSYVVYLAQCIIPECGNTYLP